MDKRKFILIVFIVLQQALCSWIPKVAWTFWYRPIEQENHFIKALHQNHIQKLGPGWQIKYFDESMYGELANRIPKLKEAYEHPLWQDLGSKQRLDLVKLAILGQEGGVYLCMTLVMTESLDWLLNMTSNPLIENKYGEEPNLFYTYAKHNYNQRYFDSETNQSFLIGPSIETYFFASKVNNSYLNEWVSFVVDTKIQAYSQQRINKAQVIIDIARNEGLELGGFNDKYYEIQISGIIVLARKQDALDKEWKANPNKQRPLIVKDLRIWTIDSTKSGYIYLNFYQGLMETLTTTNIKKFNVAENKLTPFVSFWDQTYHNLVKFLQTDNKNKCDPKFYLLEESIVYQYVLKDYPIKFYKNPVYNQQSLGQECSVLGESKANQKKLNEIKQQFIALKKPMEILQQKVNNISRNNKIEGKELANINERNEDYQKIMMELMIKKQTKQSFVEKLKQMEKQNSKSDKKTNKSKEKAADLGKAESKISKEYKGIEQGMKQLVDHKNQKKQQKKDLLIFGSIVISTLIILIITVMAVLLKKFVLQLQEYNVRKIYAEISNRSQNSFRNKIVTSPDM